MNKAIIFYMDGVISDTQYSQAKIESNILARYGCVISPEEMTKKYAGVRAEIFFSELLAGKDVDIDAILREKVELAIKDAKAQVPEIPGAISLINKAKEAGLKIAVASGSTLEYVNVVLKKLNVFDKFDAVVSSEEVKNGKPEPDVFLLAAKRIGVTPENCIVIEDGISGMIAAKKAGMLSIGLVKDRNDNSYPADIRVESLKEINLKE